MFCGLLIKALMSGIERHPSQTPEELSSRMVITGLIKVVNGMVGRSPYLDFELLVSITTRR